MKTHCPTCGQPMLPIDYAPATFVWIGGRMQKLVCEKRTAKRNVTIQTESGRTTAAYKRYPIYVVEAR